MPNIYNFSVSEFTFTEAITDAVYAGNMISGGTMTIFADNGYTVSAIDFSANNPLPGQFSSVTFADSGTAATVGNTVIVTFVFSTLFEMSAGLTTINLPISGHGRPITEKRTISYSIKINDDTVANLNGSTVVKVGGVIQTPTTSAEGVETVTLTGTADISTNTLIGNLETTADNGFIFLNSPNIILQNLPSGSVFLQLESVERRDGEDDVYIFKHKIGFRSNVDITTFDGAEVFVQYRGLAAKSTTKEITRIISGNPEISISGETRTIQVVGSPGAEFDLSVTKASDNSSIMDANLTNADVLHQGAGLIRGINKTLVGNGQNFVTYNFTQVFPKQSSATTYHINVTPKNGTILNSNIAQQMPQVILNQHINPTLTLTTNKRSLPINSPADIVYIGRPNKRPAEIRNNKKVVDFFQINYQLTHTSGAGNTVTAGTPPTWSSTDQTASSWTNSVTANNGGTHIEIVNIAVASGDPTATVTADVVVKKFGTTDVTMRLDLTDFIST
tara:strand:- start:2465 stop:3976 length:1512 start_codon:yes stop_codon:yes gene_type:complete